MCPVFRPLLVNVTITSLVGHCCAKKYEIGESAERGNEPVCGFRRQVFGTFQAHGQVESPIRSYSLGEFTTNHSISWNAKVLSRDPISLVPKDIVTSMLK